MTSPCRTRRNACDDRAALVRSRWRTRPPRNPASTTPSSKLVPPAAGRPRQAARDATPATPTPASGTGPCKSETWKGSQSFLPYVSEDTLPARLQS
ncbi:hypothetical protein BDA96_10G344700 [Sorghum bicolor]|uniref:Uncharacterized protein n=2 Tax=Sorghum bicolor TaxID=4558 RepID=A0A921U2X1_SORBI|nr:hypothetical protein BDA96_10G344700 [Sorghum bicolor]OQU77114.1 hypothetical protein SORBI_3010G267650 [Sorghum bicolor]